MAKGMARSASLATVAVLCLGVSVVRAEEMSTGEKAMKASMGVAKGAAAAWLAFAGVYQGAVKNGINIKYVKDSDVPEMAWDKKPEQKDGKDVDGTGEKSKTKAARTDGWQGMAKQVSLGGACAAGAFELAMSAVKDIQAAMNGEAEKDAA